MNIDEVADLILNELDRRRQRRETLRTLRDASNPFELPEEIFRRMYRLNIEGARDIFQEILHFLSQGQRNTRTTPLIRFFTTLHFLAHGCYQKPIGQDHLNSSSQPNVSRSINEIVNIMVDHLANLYIKFPRTQRDIILVKNGFFNKHEIPGIIGCIDCTHIKITPPDDNIGYPPNVFVNRKNFYSINCQVICDADMKVLNINARYPGSVHDAAIWRTSAIKMILHQNFVDGDHTTYLIGDSGYPLQPYLLTPIVGAVPNTPEGDYTQRHQEIRNVIERFNGVFKGVWRCLNPDRVLHYKPEKVAKIVYACAVLHNFMRQRNMPVEYPILPPNDGVNENDEYEVQDAELLRWGHIIRNRVINNYF